MSEKHINRFNYGSLDNNPVLQGTRISDKSNCKQPKLTQNNQISENTNKKLKTLNTDNLMYVFSNDLETIRSNML